MTSSTPTPRWPVQPSITAADDDWHDLSPHWWETETNWWGFYVPERRLAGALYTQALGNQHTCNGGAWVWDDSSAGSIYERFQRGLPFPDRGDQRHITFPNGVSVSVLEPLRRYRTTYADPGGLEIDLVHEGTIPPHAPPAGAWPYLYNGHFDQPMHTTGRVVLLGEELEVDCYSLRDRSWGPRPAGPTPPEKKLAPGTLPARDLPARAAYQHSVAYQFGSQDASEAFMASTDPWRREDGTVSDGVDTGYLVRGGVYAPLVAGERWISLDPETSWVRHVHLEAVDALDRELVADGDLVARWGVTPRDGVGMFEWTWSGGCHGWGEDQTFAPAGWLEDLDGRARQ
jgi:hypothetical protein